MVDPDSDPEEGKTRCADDPHLEPAIRDALASRGVKVVGIASGAAATDFVGAAEQLAHVHENVVDLKTRVASIEHILKDVE